MVSLRGHHAEVKGQGQPSPEGQPPNVLGQEEVGAVGEVVEDGDDDPGVGVEEDEDGDEDGVVEGEADVAGADVDRCYGVGVSLE